MLNNTDFLRGDVCLGYAHVSLARKRFSPPLIFFFLGLSLVAAMRNKVFPLLSCTRPRSADFPGRDHNKLTHHGEGMPRRWMFVSNGAGRDSVRVQKVEEESGARTPFTHQTLKSSSGRPGYASSGLPGRDMDQKQRALPRPFSRSPSSGFGA
jgi:hypothetical protein